MNTTKENNHATKEKLNKYLISTLPNICKDCSKEIPKRSGKGRQPVRCEECKDKHSKQYMRNYSKAKREEKRRKQKNNRWNLDNIPTYDEVFGFTKVDCGTGIDRGSSQD
ncbi:hypothetical protein IIA15_01030 [candidate division TA06 bacterium]|nr:hypothetical protein [candidate division TA06 bacterium]